MRITLAMNRLLALMFFVVGAIGAVAAPLHLMNVYEAEAAKETALAGAPPARVALERFDPERDAGAAQEIALSAQALIDRRVVAPAAQTSWLVPLVATSESDAGAKPIAWLVHPRAPWTAQTLAEFERGAGPAGGVLLAIDGALIDPAPHFAAFEIATGAGLPTVPVIQPFLGGREAALAPDEEAANAALLTLLVPLGSIACGFIFWRKGRRATA